MKSKLSPVDIPDDVTIWDLIKERLLYHSERNSVALIDGLTGRQYSYGELLMSIRNVGSALSQRGFLKGDILCIISANCCQYPMALHGVLSIGGTVTTCNPRCNVDDIRNQLEDCCAQWIITSSDFVDKVKDAVQHLKDIKDIFSFDDAAGCTPFSSLTSYVSTDTEDDVIIDPKNDTALMFYSSGTTGKPKGILRTHYNIVADIHQESHPSVAISRSPGSEVYIAVLPFFHAYGCVAFTHCCLVSGDTVVIFPNYVAENFFKAMQTYQVTVLMAVTPITVDLVRRHDCADILASVHTVLTSASPISPNIERQLKKLASVRRMQQVFGMTETGIILMPTWDDDSSDGSVGVPLSNTECMIVSPGTGKELGPNENGELFIRGPTVMKGYFSTPSSAGDLDSDRWLHTGDMAHYDDSGRFYIVDRYKQLIKYNGFQLLTHPAVADAGVTGMPDLRAGELPVAFVVLKAGMVATEDEINTFVDEKVSPYNKLRGGVRFIERIPRSPSGKILRRLLREEHLKI